MSSKKLGVPLPKLPGGVEVPSDHRWVVEQRCGDLHELMKAGELFLPGVDAHTAKVERPVGRGHRSRGNVGYVAHGDEQAVDHRQPIPDDHGSSSVCALHRIADLDDVAALQGIELGDQGLFEPGRCPGGGRPEDTPTLNRGPSGSQSVAARIPCSR